MSSSVLIKGNHQGITIFLDSQISFEKLKNEMAAKFRNSASFFNNSSLTITFSGRQLDYTEEKELIDTITDNTKIKVLCVHTDNLSAMQSCVKEQNHVLEYSSVGCFYKGTLKRGQVLESRNSIVVIGNVERGARIISGGSITVIGYLGGQAYAGITGNKDAYIFALAMQPQQLRIYDTFADTQDFDRLFLFMRQQIVIMQAGQIIISGLNNLNQLWRN